MVTKSLKLKSIYEILEYNFFIPSYQRGYKWDNKQVEELLNDIYEFAQKKSRQELQKGEFYCLQPIVVLKDNDKYKVIDGQQRLTTIYISLKYLEDIRKLLNPKSFNKIFNLEYETRIESECFLKEKLTQKNKENPDFYYMSEAYITIKNWFEENETKVEILNVLIGYDRIDKKDISNNIRFIWYELDETEDEIKVFTRLNIGKIPLSNSELIKALLLYEKSENEKREIISMWDNMEKQLQNDRFFNFLTKQEYHKTRIDFIFNLIALKYNKNRFNTEDKKFSFYLFEYLIKQDINNKKILWSEVKEYFRIFKELYDNNIYYHYVGYYINSNEKNNIQTIINLFKENFKDKFENKLKELLSIKIFKQFKELSYDEDYNDIEKSLFLFNVIITMNSGYSKYPFDIHNKENWSLEHIHAQNSDEVTRDIDMKTILTAQLELKYISKEIKMKIKHILEDISQKKFQNIQEEIFKSFGDDFSVHTIDNIALLSKDNNSSLNNSLFPQKRDKIKKLDKIGCFIPLGTKNVFMKYYSIDVKENLTWNKEDRKKYLEELEGVLSIFIKEIK